MEEHVESRIKKLEELKGCGVEPYGGPFEADSHAKDLQEKYGSLTNEDLHSKAIASSVAGRLITLRGFGKAVFAHLQDSTGRIQIYMRKDILGDDAFKLVKLLDSGDIVGAKGVLFRTKTDELTLEVRELTLLSKSLRPLPEKWHGLKDIELRYRQRYVDLIVNPEVRETFQKRSAIIKAMREFLESSGFMEVETPMMHTLAGGAAAKPFRTHHIALGLDLYLRIAPELHLKRLLVGGYERVFEINRNFRNEGISTRHNPEFTMLEFYVAYKDYDFLMGFTEELISHIANKVLGTLKLPFEGGEIDLTPPWPRIPMLDAMKNKGVPSEILYDCGKAVEWAKKEGIDIKKGASLGKALDEIFKEKVEPHLLQPTFITDYPVELSPLAKRKKDNPALVERFELFVAGREIANAFSELNDPQDQRGRFEEQVRAKELGDEETHPMDEDFIRALEHGLPPAAGEGIGIDRLVMLFTDSPSIRDVILFPLLRPE